MTVKELIEILVEYPEDAKVVIQEEFYLNKEPRVDWDEDEQHFILY
jgi:hypothetical protein